MTNPLNYDALDDFRVKFGKKVKPLITTNQALSDAINRVYEKSTSALDGLDEIEGRNTIWTILSSIFWRPARTTLR